MATVAERGAALLAFALAASAGEALAQPVSAAQALFEEGRRLLSEGDVPAACAKFAESQRIEPAGGTLLNLAACHARKGMTATAWAEFNDALVQARRDGRADRVDEAKRQIALIEPQLPRVTVSIAPQTAERFAVSLDGLTLGPASWGTALPVDPGDHELLASAPGFASWSAHVSAQPGKSTRVLVPALTPASGAATESAAPPAPTSEPVEASKDASSSPTAVSGPPVAAYVLFGVGAVGVGVGTYFGLVAASKKHDSQVDCNPGGSACTSEGASLLRDANVAAWASDVGFGIGIAAIGGAAFLLLTRHPSAASAHALRVTPRLGSSGLGLGLDGSW